MVTIQSIEERLQALRDEWVNAPISRREVILIQARALEIAKERLLKRRPQQTLI